MGTRAGTAIPALTADAQHAAQTSFAAGYSAGANDVFGGTTAAGRWGRRTWSS